MQTNNKQIEFVYGDNDGNEHIIICDGQSKGHISFTPDYELFEFEGRVYRSHLTNVIDLVTGYRCGARFEGTVDHCKRFGVIA